MHPQSLVHSMVEFVDGSTLAQVSPPDMRLPIALGLAWPDRLPHAGYGDRLVAGRHLGVPAARRRRLPRRRSSAGRPAPRGGTAPAALNAANEECVAAFLDGRLPYLGDRRHRGRRSSATHAFRERPTLAEVLETEDEARRRARELVGEPAILTER